jgi:hypothetical protein
LTTAALLSVQPTCYLVAKVLICLDKWRVLTECLFSDYHCVALPSEDINMLLVCNVLPVHLRPCAGKFFLACLREPNQGRPGEV